MADDGGLGVMPPATALTAVSLIGGTVNDVANVAALGPTVALPQGTSRTPVLESPAILSPPVVPTQPSLGVSLSPATAPYPQKLVDKIRLGQYVEMRDLLTDNVSLLDQLDTLGGPHVPPGLPGTFKPRLREVTALPTWTYCFLAYVALQTDDQKVKDQLAYARLIIREAQRHTGSGWLDYDRVFRQQAALDPALKWNSLHPGIQASTLVGQVANAHMLCRLCREPDHSANQCALWYLQPPTSNLGVPGSSSTQRFPGRRQDSRANLCLSWNSA